METEADETQTEETHSFEEASSVSQFENGSEGFVSGTETPVAFDDAELTAIFLQQEQAKQDLENGGTLVSGSEITSQTVEAIFYGPEWKQDKQINDLAIEQWLEQKNGEWVWMRSVNGVETNFTEYVKNNRDELAVQKHEQLIQLLIGNGQVAEVIQKSEIKNDFEKANQNYSVSPDARFGTLWSAERSEDGNRFEISIETFKQVQEQNYPYKSVEEVRDASGLLSPDFERIAESKGGDVLKENGDGWFYKSLGAMKWEEVISRDTKNETGKKIIDGLYERGFATATHVNTETGVVEHHFYHADRVGRITYEVHRTREEAKTGGGAEEPKKTTKKTATQNPHPEPRFKEIQITAENFDTPLSLQLEEQAHIAAPKDQPYTIDLGRLLSFEPQEQATQKHVDQTISVQREETFGISIVRVMESPRMEQNNASFLADQAVENHSVTSEQVHVATKTYERTGIKLAREEQPESVQVHAHEELQKPAESSVEALWKAFENQAQIQLPVLQETFGIQITIERPHQTTARSRTEAVPLRAESIAQEENSRFAIIEQAFQAEAQTQTNEDGSAQVEESSGISLAEATPVYEEDSRITKIATTEAILKQADSIDRITTIHEARDSVAETFGIYIEKDTETQQSIHKMVRTGLPVQIREPVITSHQNLEQSGIRVSTPEISANFSHEVLSKNLESIRNAFSPLSKPETAQPVIEKNQKILEPATIQQSEITTAQFQPKVASIPTIKVFTQASRAIPMRKIDGQVLKPLTERKIMRSNVLKNSSTITTGKSDQLKRQAPKPETKAGVIRQRMPIRPTIVKTMPTIPSLRQNRAVELTPNRIQPIIQEPKTLQFEGVRKTSAITPRAIVAKTAETKDSQKPIEQRQKLEKIQKTITAAAIVRQTLGNLRIKRPHESRTLKTQATSPENWLDKPTLVSTGSKITTEPSTGPKVARGTQRVKGLENNLNKSASLNFSTTDDNHEDTDRTTRSESLKLAA